MIFRFYNRRGFWPGVCCHGTKQGTSEYERSDEEAHDELRVVENGSKPISEGPGGRDLTLAETTNLYPLLPSLALIILCNIPRGELPPRLLQRTNERISGLEYQFGIAIPSKMSRRIFNADLFHCKTQTIAYGCDQGLLTRRINICCNGNQPRGWTDDGHMCMREEA